MGLEKILVVDDDSSLLELISMRLEHEGYDIATAANAKEAIGLIKQQHFDISIVDLQLENENGINLMVQMHSIKPDMPVIILTAHGSIESAVEAIKKGAFNYLTKPFNSLELLLRIKEGLESRRLTSEIKELKSLLQEKHDFSNVIAKSDKMKKVLEQAFQIAKTDSTVFISGESGTGKELIARAIHQVSERRDKAFIAINCSAIPDSLFESEFFGHEKGAFTGAVRSKKGFFSYAHEGTIFLDEIGDMPLLLQSKLLRVFQERQFYPIGGEKPVEVNVRVIVATNKDLEEEVKKGNFREDLFYRIHVIPIHLPPLRERKEDIPYLTEYFIKRFNRQMKKNVKGITTGALQKLMLYDWPGNIRELENTIEYAVAMSSQNLIVEDVILHKKDVSDKLYSLKEARDAFEKGYLVNLLKLTKGNISKASELAGKYRADFYNLLKKHAIKPENFKNS